MFDAVIQSAIRQRIMVICAVLAMAALGLYHFSRLPLDALPDITNVQVQVNTSAPGYTPLEVEQRISAPMENLLAGLAGVQQTRSLSRYGLSQITLIFADGADLKQARQQVSERLQQAAARLPAGVSPSLGPPTSGLGEIYLWTVQARADARKADGQPYSLSDVRDIQERIIRPQLRNLPGVAEINSIGGDVREYLIAPIPERMAAYGVSWQDIAEALARNAQSQGAGYIEKRGEQYLVRTPAAVRGVEDLRLLSLGQRGGAWVRLQDVAELGAGRELRTGAATANGSEVVLGAAFMQLGENSRNVALTVRQRLQEIKAGLPAGIEVTGVYDRTVLVEKAMQTVRNNLLEGAALVVAVLFLFLGNLRAACIVALVIPLSLLFTFSGMAAGQVSANLMSLGALDFGIIVDGAVVIVENCMRRLAQAQGGAALPLAQRLRIVFEAVREVRRPLLLGQLIIMLVYVPVFAFQGVEGRMFHPLAFSVLAALLGALLLSLSFIPAALALFLRHPVREHEPGFLRAAHRAYARLLPRVMAAPAPVLCLVLCVLLWSGVAASRLGAEFVPNLNEGDFAMQALRMPGTGLAQSVAMQQQLERQLQARFPEIERIFARTGSAEIATDPMPPNISDVYLMLKPEAQWPVPRKTRQQLLQAMQQEAAQIPGANYEFSQPIQLRFNELLSGVRSELALKIYGDDLQQLRAHGEQLAARLSQIRGAREVRLEQSDGLPMLDLQIERQQAARYGLNPGEIQNQVAAALGGQNLGAVYEGERRVEMVMRLPERLRNDVQALRRLPLPLPGTEGKNGEGQFIGLSEVANFKLSQGPAQISRENGQRRLVISLNLQERDVASFVAEAKASLASHRLPPSYSMRWSGSFENLENAMQRLQIIAPLTLGLILALLYAVFGNLRDGLLVFAGIPFALCGGVLALAARGLPFSIAAAVGFIALCGVAVLNGLVLLSAIRQARARLDLAQAIHDGAQQRLRPVLMTALVAALGFVPMALASGAGAEVQRPLATVVIGGILSSTALTLLLLPMLYGLAYRRQAAQRTQEQAPESAPDALVSAQ